MRKIILAAAAALIVVTAPSFAGFDRRALKHDHYTIRTAPTDEGPSTLAP
jgi:hypothetical protein